MTLVETARRLAPEFAAAAEEGDRLRRLPDATWRSLIDSGLVRGLQPARWGGGEAPLSDFMDAVVEVSRANPSAGWVMGVMGVHPWQLALFDDRAQQEMWGEDPTRIHSSSYMPTGKATRVEGGYRLEGRWSFSSGCDHGHGVNLGAIVGVLDLGDGMKVPDYRSLLVLPGDYEIEDNWHTAGLRATGSKDIVVSGAFVPDHRVQSHLDYAAWTPLPGQKANDAPLYRMSWSAVFNLVLAASVFGMARGFLDAWTEVTANRVVPPKVAQRDDPLTQIRLAEAEWTWDAAVSKLRRAVVEMQDIAERGEHPSDDYLARIRWDANHGCEAVGAAVHGLYHATTGRTAFTGHPLHRLFQDVQTGLGHAYLAPEGHARNFAGHLLGAGPQVLTA
jgi:3-hydroxy-9,10-secoandrosta-1,3,5(10)-triene-9,17-dione monooxygenase